MTHRMMRYRRFAPLGRDLPELRQSVAALDLALTPAESRGLDLEDGGA